ncbi:MAG: GNAT family N-acetyltransferase [Bryobacteraceae bacterium]|jgi:ribosomal protein S18 acetylase RimI-like enzyme
MPALRDPAAIRSILSTDPAWSVYALGDLAPGFFEHCVWFQPPDGAPALALLFSGFSTPVLFTLGEAAAVASMLDEIEGQPALYLHVRPEIVPVLATRYRIVELKEMLRMVLDQPAYRPVPIEGAVRLGPADLGELARLYDDGKETGEAPDFFFLSMLQDGVFFGIREAGGLVAAAGTHLAVPSEGVAAVGNVYTRRDRRGRGLAARTTSAVVNELLRMNLRTIALNVGRNNEAAIRVYERLGFLRYCTYYEGLARRTAAP